MYFRRMVSHSAIIQELGGIRKVARALHHPRHTTVQGWADRDRIPVDHWPDVLSLAKEKGVELDADDLMRASSRPQAAA